MADFPYTQSHGNIKKLLEQIQSVGKPAKVTVNWLVSIGLKSSNDRNLLGLLKFIGFIDNTGTPTDVWMAYRDKSKSPVVLAEAVRFSYSKLFDLYPDANRKDDEALRNFFNANTSVGAAMVTAMVNTFKAIASLGDFNSEVSEKIEEALRENGGKVLPKKQEMATLPIAGNGLAVTVNIQLQIAATEDASIYDKFFESLYKHVISKNQQ